MGVEQIINEEAIEVIKWGTGIIGILIGALVTIHTKWIIDTIKACNKSLKEEISTVKEFTHETRDLVNQSHNRITEHIITHHTRKDP